MNHREDRFSELLSQQFPNITSASAEIINLHAILDLPKGTEHFLSDLHGEDKAFCQLLKNASGEIRLKIADVFSEKNKKAEKNAYLSQKEQDELAFLIYDPEQILAHTKKTKKTASFYHKTLSRLILLCRAVADKYTRSKVRKALPEEYAYILEELLHRHPDTPDRREYHKSIIDAIISVEQGDAFICALCALISRLAVDRLHILGDIFDRGSGPHRILDTLQTYHSVDICWGNHDILWMGAHLGNPLSVASAVRITLRYNHPELLEQGYGIPLRKLFGLGDFLYQNDACACFLPKGDSSSDRLAVARAHKAITVILWKLELLFSRTHSCYEQQGSCTLQNIDWHTNTVTCDGISYPLLDANFPTVNPEKPWLLTLEEQDVIADLCQNFKTSEKLGRHVRFLIQKGGMYHIMNGNLLYHGCIPLTEDGSFASFLGYRGRALMDYCDQTVRRAYFLEESQPEKQSAVDFLWYLFSGKHSPLFGKNEMKTLPRYLIADKTAQKEIKNPYYRWMEEENGKKIAQTILADFSLYEDTCRIINGHVPVRQNRGESPQKAGGVLFMIDGGISETYRETTGISGYTLLYNSHGFFLTAHNHFCENHQNHSRILHSYRVIGDCREKRIRVSDTDTGLTLRKRIRELRRLIGQYQSGNLPQNPTLKNFCIK